MLNEGRGVAQRLSFSYASRRLSLTPLVTCLGSCARFLRTDAQSWSFTVDLRLSLRVPPVSIACTRARAAPRRHIPAIEIGYQSEDTQ